MTIVIAHRGASGYLPEHTLSAAAFAYALGADYIEQDVVLSRDSYPVVLHDVHLDQVTNVKNKFPDRSRVDGRWYARDFDLLELKQLTVHERAQLDGSGAVFPKRFPYGQGNFQIPTLQEEIDLIKGLNQSTGRNVGIYPEIKKPAWHRNEGADISKIVLEVLSKNNYESPADNIFLQCFDSKELKRIKNTLNSSLPLIQLIGSNSWKESDDDYDLMLTKKGVKNISYYATGVGPYLQLLFQSSVTNNNIQPSVFSQFVRENNLLIHPYTFREDAVPLAFKDFPEMVSWFAGTLNVDGMFTDFVDKTVNLLE